MTPLLRIANYMDRTVAFPGGDYSTVAMLIASSVEKIGARLDINPLVFVTKKNRHHISEASKFQAVRGRSQFRYWTKEGRMIQIPLVEILRIERRNSNCLWERN